ncbi:unnamed protein product [Diamesa tonsa]
MQNLCRLCGEQKAEEDLVIDLNDETSMNVSLKEFIEYCNNDYVECQQSEQDRWNVVNVNMSMEVEQNDESKYGEFVDYCEQASVLQFKEELKDEEEIKTEDVMKNYPQRKRKKKLQALLPYHINVRKTDTMLDGEVTEIGMKLMMNSKAWNNLSYDCTHCDVIFNSFWELLQHFKKEIADGTERIIKCTECPKVSFVSNTYEAMILTMGIIWFYMQIYLPCYYGNKIATASDNLVFSLYNCEWFEMPIKARKLIILIMINSQKTMHIGIAAFFRLTMEQFGNIVNSIYTLYTLFRDIQ